MNSVSGKLFFPSRIEKAQPLFQAEMENPSRSREIS